MTELATFLRQHDDYVLLTHARPDGDTLGSAAALCRGLCHLGKKAVLAPNPDMTAMYAPYVEGLVSERVSGAQTVISIDTASRGLLPEPYRHWRVDYRIDHHPTDIDCEDYALRRYVEVEAAACGEIILNLLRVLEVPLSIPVAEALYLALSTDTGRFLHTNTTARTHRMAAELLDCGINFAEIEALFSVKSRARIAVESAFVQSMHYYADGWIALGVLTRAMREEAGAEEDDIIMVSSLPRNVAGVRIGVCLREEDGGSKLSVRTLEPYAANLICQALGGGGHIRAAGGFIALPPDEARARVLDVIAGCYPELECRP